MEPKEIKDALINHKGKLAQVYEFMLPYEAANWSEVSRQMIIHNIDEDVVAEAYMDSLNWYRELTLARGR